MLAKDKANELGNKFYRGDIFTHNKENHLIELKYAIKSALICVEEIIEQWEYISTYLGDGQGTLNPNLSYWYEVKNEILKL